MINNMPDHWENKNELEMLFLFYQYTDELLSENTPSTYALPMHNTLTLVDEAMNVYSILKQYDCIDTFYQKYLIPIIEELCTNIELDYLLKRVLGKRLHSIITGLNEQKTTIRY